jgi:hypothetical protein
VPRERCAERTSAGLSLAMPPHVAAWHDATADRVHRYAATAARPSPKVDAHDELNARVAAEMSDSPPELVWRGLLSSASGRQIDRPSKEGTNSGGFRRRLVQPSTKPPRTPSVLRPAPTIFVVWSVCAPVADDRRVIGHR